MDPLRYRRWTFPLRGSDGPGGVHGLGVSEIWTGAPVRCIGMIEKVTTWASGTGVVILRDSLYEPLPF